MSGEVIMLQAEMGEVCVGVLKSAPCSALVPSMGGSTSLCSRQARIGVAQGDQRCSKLSQNTSTIAVIMRLSAVAPGRFSSRLMVGCEHSSRPLSGSRPTQGYRPMVRASRRRSRR